MPLCFLFLCVLFYLLLPAHTNQIAITPPSMKPVLSRSTMAGGDHMFLFARTDPVCTLSWQIINNFPLTLKKLVHWTINYMDNKSSNPWPPCCQLYWPRLCSFSTCLAWFLMTSKGWQVARFQLPSSACLCSLLLSLPVPLSWNPSGKQHPIPSPSIYIDLFILQHISSKPVSSLCMLVFYSAYHAVN